MFQPTARSLIHRSMPLSRDCRPRRDGDQQPACPRCDLGGPVDFVLIDGWPGGKAVARAPGVEIVAPQIRAGGLVMNDNGEQDYLAYVRDPAMVSGPCRCPSRAPPSCRKGLLKGSAR